MSDKWASLEETLQQAWKILKKGSENRGAAARHIALATAGLNGGAEVRTVVLRAAKRKAGVLTFYTDLATRKVSELATDPHGSCLVWDPKKRLQIRCRVELSLQADVIADWAALDETARHDYGGNVAPGTPIGAPEDFVPVPDPARFAVVKATINEIETVHLGRDIHRRASFRREDGFKGTWLAP